MIELDTVSNLVKVDTDHTLLEIDRRLWPEGLTLGYLVPPDNSITVEEAISKKKPNLFFQKYGQISDLCVALSLETDSGEVIQTTVAPRHATGPGWKNIIIGSEQKLGSVYQAFLKVFPLPEAHSFFVFEYEKTETSLSFERELSRKEIFPLISKRFASKELGEELFLSSSKALVLEFADSEKMIRALSTELVQSFPKIKKIEASQLENRLAILLRKISSQDFPAGERKSRSDSAQISLQKRIFQSIVKGNS